MFDGKYCVGEDGDAEGECYGIHGHGIGGKYGSTKDVVSFEFNSAGDELCGGTKE